MSKSETATHITREQCRAARCYLDWSRHDLAKACGVSPETIRNLEQGTFSPTHSTEQAIIAAFEAQGLQFTEGGVKRQALCAQCRQPLQSSQPEERHVRVEKPS
jgi:DNA-binding XRE family transcriptional regulator